MSHVDGYAAEFFSKVVSQPAGAAAGVPAAGGAGVEAAGVSPASAEYKKQVDGWNAKVNAFKAASPEQLAAMRPEMDAAKASMEKARQGLMKEADADFKRQQSALVVVSDDGVLIQPAPTVGVTVGVKVQPNPE